MLIAHNQLFIVGSQRVRSLCLFQLKSVCSFTELIKFLSSPLQVVRDSDLFRLLGALVFVDVLLLVIWMTLHPPSREVVQTDGTQTVR